MTAPSQNLRWRLDLTTLRYFVAICDEGSLNRAAEREAIAPSAVSKRLAELEQTLGVQLLVRQTRGMTTTSAGETLLHHARQMMFRAERIVLELSEHADGIRGYVRMLANLSAIVQFLPSDLHSFVVQQGAIKVDLEERPSRGVVTGVEDGWAELGICVSSVDTRQLHTRLYRRDDLVVVMTTDHALAGLEEVALKDTLEHDHVGLNIESSIHHQVRAEAHRSGLPLRVRLHAPAFDAVCRMAQAKLGIGVLPRIVFELLGRPMGLVGVPLTDRWAKRELQIVTRDQRLSPAADLLVAHLLADTG